MKQHWLRFLIRANRKLSGNKRKSQSRPFLSSCRDEYDWGWKGDGWWYIICEQADLVPYIPMTLEKLNLPELKTAFENVINLFPEYTVFKLDYISKNT